MTNYKDKRSGVDSTCSQFTVYQLFMGSHNKRSKEVSMQVQEGIISQKTYKQTNKENRRGQINNLVNVLKYVMH